MVAAGSVRGFTLVEMLVSVVILTAMIGLASFAFSLFSRHWDGHIGDFESAQARYQRLEWLAAALEDTLPYVVQNDAGARGFYFLGRDEGLTLVTQSPIFAPGEPAVIRVFREPGPAGEGWLLVYEEAPFEDQVLGSADQRLEFRSRLVVAQLDDTPRFRFFGWADWRARAEQSEGLPVTPHWFDEYDGMDRLQHPSRIGIDWEGGGVVFRVPDRADATLARAGASE